MHQPTRFALGLFLAGLTTSVAAPAAHAAAPETFSSFLTRTATMTFESFRARPDNQVATAADFEEMRQHILTMYSGVNVQHSFLAGNEAFDCIPVNQQPSLRLSGSTSIADPPPSTVLTAPSDSAANGSECAAGTIPMHRLSLETMSRFATLQQFFRKEPAVAATHKYSYTYQYADATGGTSTLNLWSPTVNVSTGEIFSLSQEWYIGGSGSNTQTAEVGWQNYPAMYGVTSSVPFIYWTADNYARTGCYNLDCVAFVQVNNTYTLGAPFPNYSTTGGKQYEFSAAYLLHGGNWWLAFNGTWIGYYPVAVYKGGALSQNATLIEFGSEGVGTTVWPPEGSGAFSDAGYGYAAYQRGLAYFDRSGALTPDALTAEEPSPACYTITGPQSSQSGKQVFFEGGPGGTGC